VSEEGAIPRDRMVDTLLWRAQKYPGGSNRLTVFAPVVE